MMEKKRRIIKLLNICFISALSLVFLGALIGWLSPFEFIDNQTRRQAYFGISNVFCSLLLGPALLNLPRHAQLSRKILIAGFRVLIVGMVYILSFPIHISISFCAWETSGVLYEKLGAPQERIEWQVEDCGVATGSDRIVRIKKWSDTFYYVKAIDTTALNPMEWKSVRRP